MVAISEFPSIRLEFSLTVQLRVFSKHNMLFCAFLYFTSSRTIQLFYNVDLPIVYLGLSILTSRLIIEVQRCVNTIRQASNLNLMLADEALFA